MTLRSRREFLKDSSLFAAATAAFGSMGHADEKEAKVAQPAQPVKKVAASERIRVAVIGFNGQGKGHLDGYASNPDSIVTVICDVDSRLADGGIKRVAEKQGSAPRYVQDLRRIMEDKDVDAVSIATPNHWHALAAIWAIQAGKDVYVEKPVSHNVFEGRQIVEAARRYKRICQTGTQSRSNEGMRAAIDYVLSGKIGKVTLARGLCYKPRGTIGPRKEATIPDGVDYDLWCGPAPLKPSYRNGKFGPLHYDWHWFWDYGNGDLGNQGIHEMDKARWGLNKNTLPNAVKSLGGRFGYADAGETANTQVCFFDYGDKQLIFEVRGLKTDGLKSAKVGNIWYGSEGVVVSSTYSSAVAFDKDGNKVKEFSGGGNHFTNFLKAVRSRKQSDLTADIEEGHLSSALCHLGNISYRLGAEVKEGGADDGFGNAEERDSIARMLAHLKDNEVRINATGVRVGPRLGIDPKSESFTDKRALPYLTREYRKGFVVPEKV